MSGHYDRNEARARKSRESALFRDFKAILSLTRSHAPALRRQTRDVNIAAIRRGEDLARVPVLRGAQIARMVADDPPFGGRLATRPGFMRQLFFGTASGHSRDWWNAARAMHAAGFVRGDIVLNCASYHMRTGGHMIEGGAMELGCCVIPAGSSKTGRHLEAIRTLRPTGFCGKPGALRKILERADAEKIDVSSIRKALVFGAPLSSHFRREAAARGIVVRQAYTTPDAGIVAFETSKPDGSLNEGMIVNEGVFVEIVRLGGDAPVGPDEVGEIVVTRLNVDLPVLRVGTGDLSRVLAGPSPCGRTNLRIAGWMGRVEDAARIGERRICPSQILAMNDRHACVKRMLLVVNGEGTPADTTLRVEGPRDDPQLPINLRATMQSVLGFEARVDIVGPGALGDGARLIVDERVHA